ncbi:hypothetical protein CYY_007213 [Polysphondylium violaceum]|uniref:non-specific serine/threonine protein kinase n=1 Tax=Polysphondylium violaceum TaxID=133409 RepID=A0A8J4UXT7_9MYCE|nr:hypothetical protein CYY_007213 [Polysphondylium violaceum]
MSLFDSNKSKRLSKIIDYSEIKFDDLNQVGSGGFGKVYAGYLNGRKVGIKKITIYDNDPNKEILSKFLLREIYTLKMLSHPNVIQFYGMAVKDKSYYLLTELVSGGDLHWYIKHKKNKMNYKLILLIARDIASAMKYLHDNGVIHRDLKSTNLLVSEGWVIKVCDMGLARTVNSVEKSKMTICGTDDYMAPEVMIGEEYDQSCDVFSFGMVLVEMILRESLTPRMRNEDLGLDKPYLLNKLPKDCPDEFRQLILHCCKIQPSARPSFEQIHGLICHLLEQMTSLAEPEYPSLRTFKPPDLHIPVSKNKPSQFSFPRPYQESSNNLANTLNASGNSNQESKFSFPRPYQGSTNNLGNSLNNSSNNIQESKFSFPRPYQGSTNNLGNSLNNSQQQESKFSFPRPYQGSTNNLGNSLNSSSNNSQQESKFSFPIPYEPSEESKIYNNNNNNNPLLSNQRSYQQPFLSCSTDSDINDLQCMAKDINFSDSPSGLCFSKPFQSIDDQFNINNDDPLQIDDLQYNIVQDNNNSNDNDDEQNLQVISFEEFELLDFPRPYQPDGVENTQPTQLIETPDYSFPRPWNPDIDPPIKSRVVTSIARVNTPDQLKKQESKVIQSISINNEKVDFKEENNNNDKIVNTSKPKPVVIPVTKTPDIIITTSDNNTVNNNNNNNNNDRTNSLSPNETSPLPSPTSPISPTSPTSPTSPKSSHGRSRSLDFKQSTKAIIKKFEELTRFHSQNNVKKGETKETSTTSTKERSRDGKDNNDGKEKEKERDKDKDKKKEKTPPPSPTKVPFWKSKPQPKDSIKTCK